MINPDSDLGFATRLGEENPDLFKVFPSASIMGVEAGILAASFVNRTFPDYGKQGQDLSDVLRNGAGPLKCDGRAAVIHAMLAEIPDIYPGIVAVDIKQYSSRHLLNVGLDPRTGEVFFVDNGMSKSKKAEEGTFEIILNPWASRNTPPEMYGAIFETAMAGIEYLYKNPFDELYKGTVKFIDAPFEDDGYTSGKRMHLLPAELPCEEELSAISVQVLKDTQVVVLNPDASSRLADRIAYGNQTSSYAA